jgi:hypothetical protein
LMKLELRAIREKQTGRAALPTGFGGVVAGELEGLVEVIGPDFNLGERQRLLRYKAALEEWWQNGAVSVLPVRAGAAFSGPQEVAQLLQEQAAQFEADLKRLAGKVEMGLLVTLPGYSGAAERIPETATHLDGEVSRGIAYMQHLTQRHVQEVEQNRGLETIVSNLGQLAVAQQYTPPAPGATFVRATFLVERERLAEFRQNVNQCGLTLVITGPLPPFSFV